MRTSVVVIAVALMLLASIAATGSDRPAEPTGFRDIPFGADEAYVRAHFRSQSDWCLPSPQWPSDLVCLIGFDVADIPVKASFTLVGEPGARRMSQVSLTFAADKYEGLRSAFTDRYGKPDERKEQTLKNRMGATFENETLFWIGPTTTMSIQRYSGSVDKGYAFIATKEFMGLAERRRAARRGERSGGL